MSDIGFAPPSPRLGYGSSSSPWDLSVGKSCPDKSTMWPNASIISTHEPSNDHHQRLVCPWSTRLLGVSSTSSMLPRLIRREPGSWSWSGGILQTTTSCLEIRQERKRRPPTLLHSFLFSFSPTVFSFGLGVYQSTTSWDLMHHIERVIAKKQRGMSPKNKTTKIRSSSQDSSQKE